MKLGAGDDAACLGVVQGPVAEGAVCAAGDEDRGLAGRVGGRGVVGVVCCEEEGGDGEGW